MLRVSRSKKIGKKSIEKDEKTATTFSFSPETLFLGLYEHHRVTCFVLKATISTSKHTLQVSNLRNNLVYFKNKVRRYKDFKNIQPKTFLSLFSGVNSPMLR